VEENLLKNGAVAVIILTIVLLAIPYMMRLQRVEADPDYTIPFATHTVEILYNGYALVNDTFEITASDPAPPDFTIGFPSSYGQSLQKVIAYDVINDVDLNVTLGTPLGIGFYGVSVVFPPTAPRVFWVAFVLNNSLVTGTDQLTASFPAYPALVKSAEVCNSTIILPSGAIYVSGAINSSRVPLAPLAYEPSETVFTLADKSIQMFDITSFKRQITFDQFGAVSGADTYSITNKGSTAMNETRAVLPPNATIVNAQDSLGRTITQPSILEAQSNLYLIAFQTAVEPANSTTFTVNYDLPSELYITSQGGDTYRFDITMFQHFNYYIEAGTVTFVLPEGAKASIGDIQAGSRYTVDKSLFQETVSLSRTRIISASAVAVRITYDYSPLWLSFRPSLWILALAVVGVTVIAVWKRPKEKQVVKVTVPSVAVRLTEEEVEHFIESYEEKKRTAFEITTLEERAQKGRIPRRRYKVQRKTLETRLDTIARSVDETKEKLRDAGGKYAEMMRQLEIAETRINEIEANIRSIETRHAGGDLSLESYRSLLSDYRRDIEKADTIIDGILLRLREELG
jgi:hypothetical protein